MNAFADTRRRPHASERARTRIVLVSLAVTAVGVVVGVIVGLLA